MKFILKENCGILACMQNLDKKKKKWNILPIHQRIKFSFSFFLRGNIKTKKMTCLEYY